MRVHSRKAVSSFIYRANASSEMQRSEIELALLNLFELALLNLFELGTAHP